MKLIDTEATQVASGLTPHKKRRENVRIWVVEFKPKRGKIWRPIAGQSYTRVAHRDRTLRVFRKYGKQQYEYRAVAYVPEESK